MNRKKKINEIAVKIKRNSLLYLMMLPGMAVLLLFTYGPMVGYWLAFVDYKPRLGMFGSPFVGFLWFRSLFDGGFIWEMVANTLKISLLKLGLCFCAPIVLAFLLNEVRNKPFKSAVQCVSYLPNFISWIIVSGMMVILLDTDEGLLNSIIVSFGGRRISWYSEPKKWYGILTVSHLWKNMGGSSIMFLAALTALDPELFEAAELDGANRWQQVRRISVPGIMPTVSIVLILSIGNIFKDDFEQIYGLVGENDILAETTNVISTWVYKLANSGSASSYALGTAASLIQSLVSLILVVTANAVSRRLGQDGIM